MLFVSDKIDYCNGVLETFEGAAEFHKEAQTYHTTRQNGVLHRPIFFATLNHSNASMQIFKGMDFRSVPNLLLSMPKQLTYTDPIDRNMFLRSYLWEIRPEEGLMTTYKMLMWMNKKSELDVKYQEPMWTFFYSLTIFFIVIGIFWFLLTNYRHILFKPVVMMSVCQIIYFISIAGLIWNELNNAKWAGVDKEGNASYIYPSSRGQYKSEGIFMASSICLVGVLLIAFTKLRNLKMGNMAARMLYFAIIYFSLIFVREVENVFRAKNMYAPNFFPPKNYRQGPISRDQGFVI